VLSCGRRARQIEGQRKSSERVPSGINAPKVRTAMVHSRTVDLAAEP
jgi:hypothetical protein